MRNQTTVQELSIPDIASIHDLEKYIEQLDELQCRISSLESLIQEMPAIISNELDNDREKWIIASYLYWYFPKINVPSIQNGLLPRKSPFNKFAHSQVNTICKNCGENLIVKSRTELRAKRSMDYLCKKCKEIEDKKGMEEWKIKHEKENAQHEARLILLRTMPYQEYLKTPEWQEQRKYKLKRAHYQCQLCNATGVSLNVHHRTYENRGNERDRDLIVLCKNCHAKFHDKFPDIKE